MASTHSVIPAMGPSSASNESCRFRRLIQHLQNARMYIFLKQCLFHRGGEKGLLKAGIIRSERSPSISQDVCSTWCRPACKCCLQAQTILTIPRNLADTVLEGSWSWVFEFGCGSGHYMHIKCSAPSAASVLRPSSFTTLVATMFVFLSPP